jgi:chaperonin GroEL
MNQSFNKLHCVGEETREHLFKGVNIVGDLVSATLGPGGRLICIKRTQHPADVPFTTKDGKTVAESIFLKDEYQDAGAQMVKDASIQTCKEAGDGTTTSALLAQSMFNYGLEAIKQGANPVILKKGMDRAAHDAIVALKKTATPVEGDDIRRVAIISSNGDEFLADLVSTAVIKAGKIGAVELSFSNTTETHVQVVEGCQLLSGYTSRTFITDPKTEESILDNPYILIINKKLQDISEMLEVKVQSKPLLEQISDQQRPLLIIADDIQGQALATLTFNHARGVLKCCAIRTPGYKEAGREVLEDIAVLTGATVISDDLGLKLSSIGFEHLGQAGTVKVGSQVTSILDGKANPARLQARIENIQLAQQRETDQAEIERLQLRLSQLSGGIVVIRIGGATELEVKERYYRAEDAMHATRAAVEDGIVPGGGVALLRASQDIEQSGAHIEDIGYSIVCKAMMEPLKKIAANAGYDPGYTLQDVALLGNSSYGFNAITGKLGDMKEMGILDPVKVVVSALKNAESIASQMLICEGLVLPPYE